MAANNLDELLDESDSAVELLRENAATFTIDEHFPAVPNERTNWIEEQRAIIETCALGDLSHHMTAIHFQGPDALEFFADYCVNDFSDFVVGKAKHIVLCSRDGYLIGDGPLLRLGEEEFWGVPWGAEQWIAFNLERGDYDVSFDIDPSTAKRGGNPELFIYQVQGPNAHAVLETVTDVDLLDIGFYSFEEIDLAGSPVRAFGHGMSTQPGFELHGDWKYAAAVKAAILEAGEPHGIRQLGSKAYNSQSVRLGWIGAGPPPIYKGEAMQGFREWLGANTREATFSIEGSFDSDEVTDYYMNPVEYGFGKLIDFDRDFLGKAALEAIAENPPRQFVSLLWNDEDVMDVYASLFGEDQPHKFFDLPRSRWANSAFDSVLKDDERVGLSRRRSYQPDVRSVTSLAIVDTTLSQPGTEVSVLWGEGRDSPNSYIEDHVPREIAATVAPVPYTEDLRKVDASAE